LRSRPTCSSSPRTCSVGSGAAAFAKAHYPILKQWADYLVTNALDQAFRTRPMTHRFHRAQRQSRVEGHHGIGAMSVVAEAAGWRPTARTT